jgi:hypothetical protein
LTDSDEEAAQMMTFEEVWDEQDITDNNHNDIKTLVCFLSNSESQHKAAGTIKILNPETRVVFVSQGEAYKRYPGQNYEIVKNDGYTYIEALRSIREEFGEVNGVFYLWPLEDTECIKDSSPIAYILQAIAASK